MGLPCQLSQPLLLGMGEEVAVTVIVISNPLGPSNRRNECCQPFSGCDSLNAKQPQENGWGLKELRQRMSRETAIHEQGKKEA